MNPRGKKKRDLACHCKNHYGNSDKAARKGIRRKKRRTTRQARRVGELFLAQELSSGEGESCHPPKRPLSGYTKCPDMPTGEVLQLKVKAGISSLLHQYEESADLIESFHEWCQIQLQMGPVHARAWLKFLRALTLSKGPTPGMEAEDQRNLRDKLVEFLRERIQ